MQQHDVAGLDITVNDALPMSIIQGSGQLFEKTSDLFRGDALLPVMQMTQIRGKRGALQVLHHDVRVAVDRIEIEDLHDVGMAQPCHHLCLALKAIEEQRFFFDKAMQKFDGYRAFKV